MSRLSVEVFQFVVLTGLAFALHTAIRRSGGRYAEEVFAKSPGIGRAFLILADIGFYLIFAAYILFNVQLENVRAAAGYGDYQEVLYSVAGVALIIGLLHIANVVALPLMARLLARGSSGSGTNADRAGMDDDALHGRLGELMVTVTLNNAAQ